jgi:hypothetical protein
MAKKRYVFRDDSQTPKGKKDSKIKTIIGESLLKSDNSLKSLANWLLKYEKVTDVRITTDTEGFPSDRRQWVRAVIVSNNKEWNLVAIGKAESCKLNYLIDEIKESFLVRYDETTGDL